MRLATRGSPLARWQADHVTRLLRSADSSLQVEVVIVETTGDQRRDVPIEQLGGTGVFVKEVQAAVLDGRADAAVHSAKDLPSVTAAGLRLAAVPERGDVRDALVGSPLDALRSGAVIATGSIRRRAQLAHHRPDLTFVGLRGNMATRVAAAERADIDAVVVAAVALERLGVADAIDEVLPESVVLPQIGQGALAIECRDGDHATTALLAAIEDRPTRRAVDAERAFLATLGGGCDLPAAALARSRDPDASELALEALLASEDGHVVLRHRASGDDPTALGRAVARHLLEQGGRALLPP